ncbi:hypothetical protein ACN4EG_12890 [Alkalinema pantanalense CENA528]|uniref:hypothetical protein n=1 Tax=Alkalinema pantanalense TaxID=1620705 RepID=UPI003D6E46A8
MTVCSRYSPLKIMKIHNIKGLLLVTAIVACGVAVAPSAQAADLPTITVVGQRPNTITLDRLRELLNPFSWGSSDFGDSIQEPGGEGTASEPTVVSLLITNDMLNGCAASPQTRAQAVSTALSADVKYNPNTALVLGTVVDVSFGVNAYGGRAVEQFTIVAIANNVVTVSAVPGSYSCN